MHERGQEQYRGDDRAQEQGQPGEGAAARTRAPGRSAARRRSRAARTGIAAVLAATALLGTAAVPATATAPAPAWTQRQARAWLPEPTGPHPVGTTTLHLTDTGRQDPWKPDRARELMISLWYPTARPASGDDRAPYMDPRAAEHFGSADGAAVFNYRTEPGRTAWQGIRTHARQDAPALPGRGPRPVVLYSAGLGDPRTWGTGLVEDLASRGYVVVTVDHTYDASEVVFPDGTRADSVLPGMAGPGLDVGALLRKVMRTRVDDTRFVLDELAALRTDGRLPAGLGASLDLGRIGMVGHSAGGFTAVQTMHDDPRIAAGIDMDGQLHFPGPDGTGVHPASVAEDGLDRPFLLMGTGSEDSGDYHHQPGWDALWQHSNGWKADVTLTGSRHGSYTDAQSLLPQVARQGAVSGEALRSDVGDVRPERAVAATRAYVASFFDRWLRGRDDHLLDGPSPRFPEMEFAR
ncbi:esterase [Kitasatospora sp. A2-31]|uniref:alpha/beta hydrolase family protein n=2 Tax=Kitasatospora sp. A2-31 TaxID=2916414 RepID=UPI001EE9C0AA|nr:esterase [Kitasatospora sp. A2-31]MCG6498563.1 esterase [Kitasatospora sp. A2-31]MCG6499988.1 esterase [Kitasatospora sp. A2-31]